LRKEKYEREERKKRGVGSLREMTLEEDEGKQKLT
jgi:hypothetical protein